MSKTGTYGGSGLFVCVGTGFTQTGAPTRQRLRQPGIEGVADLIAMSDLILCIARYAAGITVLKTLLGGPLGRYAKRKCETVEIHLAEPSLLIDVFNRLDLPRAEIAICVINDTVVLSSENIFMTDDDLIALYPLEGVG